MMENLLREGDYVPDGFGGFVRLHGTEKVLQRALFRLTCRRGAFCFLPELGSRLRELGREKPALRAQAARQMAAEALTGLPVRVTDAAVRTDTDKDAAVTVYLQAADGTAAAVEVTV